MWLTRLGRVRISARGDLELRSPRKSKLKFQASRQRLTELAKIARQGPGETQIEVTEEQERPGVIQVKKKDHSRGPRPGNSVLVSRETVGGEE